MNQKKNHELEVLRKIYKDENRYKIMNSEKPGFIIHDVELDETFGVEITKLYYNESSARLKEISNYVSKMLKDGIPRKDQGVLSLHQLYVSINDEWVYLGDTIGQSFKTYDDYIDALELAIRNKTKKLRDIKS